MATLGSLLIENEWLKLAWDTGCDLPSQIQYQAEEGTFPGTLRKCKATSPSLREGPEEAYPPWDAPQSLPKASEAVLQVAFAK